MAIWASMIFQASAKRRQARSGSNRVALSQIDSPWDFSTGYIARPIDHVVPAASVNRHASSPGALGIAAAAGELGQWRLSKRLRGCQTTSGARESRPGGPELWSQRSESVRRCENP